MKYNHTLLFVGLGVIAVGLLLYVPFVMANTFIDVKS